MGSALRAALLGAALLLAACAAPAPPTAPAVATATPTATPAAPCHVNGDLPDPVCTPGVINPNVTQANIHETICKHGWTTTIRPPQSYTTKLKVQGIKDYGYADTVLAHYEEDHRVPLEVGGDPTSPLNLWPERGASPNPKDAVENRVHADICSGKITVAQGEQVFLGDWTGH